jgi:hypothetical protein
LNENTAQMLAPTAPRVKDTNYAAWPAMALWRVLHLPQAADWLEAFGESVLRGLDFAVAQQSPHGDIRWAAPEGAAAHHDDALVAGNAAIFKALGAGVALAEAIGDAHRGVRYGSARRRLGEALAHKPERFDRQWGSKAHFSMDWYYPVFAGALDEARAHSRLRGRWGEFVADELGCRCVSEEPWVTVAETCELAMACLGLGYQAEARSLLETTALCRLEGGGYWMGWQFEQDVFWPADQPSWTAAAVILARDCLYAATPGSGVLIAPPLTARARAVG